MKYSGTKGLGKFAAWLVYLAAPPHKSSYYLASLNPKGFITPSAILHHANLVLGRRIFIGDRVIIFQNTDGGAITLGNRVCILRDTAIETGFGGTIWIGDGTWIHPRGQLNAYLGSIRIGTNVDIAPNCAFYAYDHGMAPGQKVREQPLQTKGDIIIEDDVWIGVGAIILSGVTIGKGAIIGAGSVVTKSIPPFSLAAGNPAHVLKTRKTQ